jgi:endonuclease-3
MKLVKSKIEELFSKLQNANPEPKGELDYHNNFTLLVAVVLSAQSTDVGVNKATFRLFKIADTPQDMLKLGIDGLTKHIKTIGLYNAKAKNVIALCEILINQHNSIVPDNRDDLVKLPGVGRKTANVVLNIAFGQPTHAVDTHIFRISNRTGLAPGKNVLEVEKGLIKRVPDQYAINAHHWLILHGRYVCLARKPKCGECIINDICLFKGKTVLS